jgi:cytochrome c5
MNLLKNNGLIVLLSAIFALGTLSAADKNDEEKSKGYIEAQKKHVFSKENIAKRTAPVGKIFVEGDDVPTAAPPPAPVNTGPRSGEQVYTQNCSACHGGGIPNAPKFGTDAWKVLAERGVDDLLKSAIAGTANGMPPRGACGNCSDDELKAAIEYMISSAQ